MSKKIDAVGKSCPMPVVMTKKEIDAGEQQIITMVDNKTSVENLKKLAENTGFQTEVIEEEGIYQVVFSKSCEECEEILNKLKTEKKESSSDYAVFLGKNYIGEGSQELGENLMRMFLYTLTESQNLPACVLLMNSGVKLAVTDEQAVEHLKTLREKGTAILVCGTCLNYYGLAEGLKVGDVSNMFDITGKMQAAGKIISF